MPGPVEAFWAIARLSPGFKKKTLRLTIRFQFLMHHSLTEGDLHSLDPALTRREDPRRPSCTHLAKALSGISNRCAVSATKFVAAKPYEALLLGILPCNFSYSFSSSYRPASRLKNLEVRKTGGASKLLERSAARSISSVY